MSGEILEQVNPQNQVSQKHTHGILENRKPSSFNIFFPWKYELNINRLQSRNPVPDKTFTSD